MLDFDGDKRQTRLSRGFVRPGHKVEKFMKINDHCFSIRFLVSVSNVHPQRCICSRPNRGHRSIRSRTQHDRHRRRLSCYICLQQPRFSETSPRAGFQSCVKDTVSTSEKHERDWCVNGTHLLLCQFIKPSSALLFVTVIIIVRSHHVRHSLPGSSLK